MSDEQNTYDGLELINCVASGTHSQIWECAEPAGTQHFVAKLLLPEAIKDKECLSTLKHEAKVQKSLVHPNFLPFHRIVTNKEHAYILMDYFRAPNVKTQLMADVMALQIRAQKLIEGLCISLAHMHDKGWIHRDIKPENILFNKSGELKLIDFSLTVRNSSGLGKMFGGAPKVVQGTRTYIAPETILKKAPTVQTDMYSLGITLFEVLAGQRPFTAPTPDLLLIKHLKEPAPAPSEFNKNITPETDQFVRRMLFKNPKKRHANMNELLAELRSLKLFKEDVAQLKAAADQKKKETADAGGDLSKAWSLDSRRDALLTEKGIAPPVKPKKKKPKLAASKPPAEPAAPAPVAAPQQPPPAAAFPGQPQPGQFPQFAPPGYYPPGMAPPMPGQPGVPMPQMPQQPFPQQQYPPQGYPPGYPQYPPGVAPVGQPPMQPPAQQPPDTPPVPSAQDQPPQQQQTAAPVQQQPPSADVISREEAELQPQAPVPNERHASQSEEDADLPLMDELPDVL
ncbi:MAG: serine/threonine protein kinase [Planctomycetaceae bacterium]|nr:serine/threonine protein kinase [Planctomycetaceae bacterium]MBT6154281.1 serine/threonine protein kinase [Planctomycetaceae bacterium]MBT6485581.1 serine/threonine protein kinase [Planctomycetaceae bacterium]MBT6495331.1 serine/threonine protein kinase [Planctomycetaceae bacterium]